MTKHLYPLLASTALFLVPAAHAQTYQPSNRVPVADSTLGTQVSGNGNNFNITGGVNKGQTLFHSFTDFSVPTNGQANFTNPVGNRDIITRVTGTVFSDINGLVNTNGANFFLINPNGVTFGTNARLNVGKAFVGSTANSIDLVDGSGRAITFGTNANGDAPLLSVAPNVLFDVSRLNMGGGTGAISNFGTLQTNNNSQYIGLIGGNVTLNGGKIIAPGGRVDIGGLNGVGTVSVDNNGLVFSSTGVGRSNVLLTNDAGITVRATGTLDTVQTFFNNATSNGSSINISANNLDILNSGAKLSGQNAAIDAGLEVNSVQTQPAGAINIDAIGKVNLSNADIKNTLRTGSEGSIGGIKIQAGTLDVKNHSVIATTTNGKGNAGNIDINTIGDINISGNDSSSTDISTIVNNSSAIGSNTYGQGDTGKITINTQGKLSLVNLGDINSSVGDTGVGNGQGIFITARELNLANFSSISSSTTKSAQSISKGNAGDINIKTTGDIQISGYDSSATNPATAFSNIYSDTNGYGDAGKITIDTQGKLSIANQGSITSNVQDTAIGNSKGISINARELELANIGFITTETFQIAQVNGKGNAGNIDIKTTGDIKIAGANLPALFNPSVRQLSYISSDTSGYGDTGKITINTQGKLSVVDVANISSEIRSKAVGNSNGISITARELELANSATIGTDTFANGKGNAGDIKIQTTGNIKISGYDSSVTNRPISSVLDRAYISSNSSGQGDAGKISIDTQGKLSIANQGIISSLIYTTGVGNSKGISITARELELANSSFITTDTFQTAQVNGKGNAGDITIKTIGDIKLSSYDSSSTKQTFSQITSSTKGYGDAGKITIDTQGKLLLSERGIIASALDSTAVGNSKGINITARELEIANTSLIGTSTSQSAEGISKGNAGDINIQTTGDIKISGDDNSLTNNSTTGVAGIQSTAGGQGDAGKITIGTQGKLSVVNGGGILSNIGKDAIGNSKGISITAREIELNNESFINTGTDQTAKVNGTGKSGDIDLQVQGSMSIDNSGVVTRSSGVGEAGNVSVSASRVSLNRGGILSDADAASGGNVTFAISDYILLRNDGFITTNSGSTGKNGNGGNITISSPLIIALPGDNNITANANGGNGGNVNITSQGLFGIQYRAQGSPLTNDITASSTFGQSGAVNVSTPGTDPGRDSTELPNTATDASNQISQVCGANNRQNKLTVTGRGGLPPTANDPLTSDVVWQDARATSSQPAVSRALTPVKLVPPAVGWIFDGKGKVTLVAAGTQGQPTGTRVVCPNAIEQ
jgi:filamentous hemagglutinin family protein